MIRIHSHLNLSHTTSTHRPHYAANRPSGNTIACDAAIGLIVTFVVALFSLGAQAQQDRVALVIGNSAYRDAPLRNPVNDARAMKQRLAKLGFRVTMMENGDKGAIERAVLTFTEQLTPATTGLFYYAGHGVQSRGRNFIIPIDADFSRESGLRVGAVDLDFLFEEMSFARNRMNIVILDACRNNPFERRFRNVQRGLARVEAGKNTLVAYATAPGAVAADGAGANGLYTSELLGALEVPGLKIEEVFKRVRVQVSAKTGDNQIPWESSSLTSDFIFNPGDIANDRTDEKNDAPARDQRAWSRIASSNVQADFERYLERFPNGQYASAARQRIAALKPTTVATAGSNGRTRTAAASTGPIRALIGPFAANNTQDWSEKVLADMAKSTLLSTRRFELSRSYYHDKAYFDSISSPSRYWRGGSRKEPNVQTVRELATNERSDVVVMVAYDGFSDTNNMLIDPDKNIIDAFVVDVKADRVLHKQGIHQNLGEILTELLEGISRGTGG